MEYRILAVLTIVVASGCRDDPLGAFVRIPTSEVARAISISSNGDLLAIVTTHKLIVVNPDQLSQRLEFESSAYDPCLAWVDNDELLVLSKSGTITTFDPVHLSWEDSKSNDRYTCDCSVLNDTLFFSKTASLRFAETGCVYNQQLTKDLQTKIYEMPMPLCGDECPWSLDLAETSDGLVRLVVSRYGKNGVGLFDLKRSSGKFEIVSQDFLITGGTRVLSARISKYATHIAALTDETFELHSLQNGRYETSYSLSYDGNLYDAFPLGPDGVVPLDISESGNSIVFSLGKECRLLVKGKAGYVQFVIDRPTNAVSLSSDGRLLFAGHKRECVGYEIPVVR
ncbi:hypothetical protein AB1L42_21255 [Thalassoglobus sp. JC818]|uniref:hypothetical protein n=1 Tax=Thalassoglobus sp. JC818 TaxID=3232136 RepID=UPI003458A309